MGRNHKKVTMSDIAARLKISKNSVSLALGNKSGVSDQLRERIINLATEMGYGSFSAQRSVKSRCIVVMVPEYLQEDAFFYADVFWAIENEAKSRGCLSVNISVSEEMERRMELPVLPHEMDILGVLVIGIFKGAYIAELCNMGLPMLSVDIAYPDISLACVGSSNIHGGYLATKFLIDNGHKKIGFIGPIYTAQSVFERWCGFYQAVLTHGIGVHEPYNITGKPGVFKLFDTIETLETYFEGREEYPTAWFCAGDRIAVALTHVLARRGIHIPRDISVMGYDDIQIAELILPRLTTVRIDRKLMGRLAVDKLLSMPEFGVVNVEVNGTLVVRDSVQPVPSA